MICLIDNNIIYLQYLYNKNKQNMDNHPLIKISEIEPKYNDFQLIFQVCEVITHAKGIIVCRIVDDTGIIDACFNRYADKFQKGGVYKVDHLKCGLIDGHPRVQMNIQYTNVSTLKMHFESRNFENDVTKKIFQQEVDFGVGLF